MSTADRPSFPPPGTDLGSLEVRVSEAANDRYWDGAGIAGSARPPTLLYPPMAVNLTILLFQRTVAESVLHTKEDLHCRATGTAGCDLLVSGRIVDTYTKRGRDYAVVESEIADPAGTTLWTSRAEFASTRPRQPDAPVSQTNQRTGDARSVERGRRAVRGELHRSLRLDAGLLRTYSRAGNFHSDAAAARAMGLPGMTAMGMQTLGPAYGACLDRWGDALIRQGTVTAVFFGLVLEDDEIDVRLDFESSQARFEIHNTTRGQPTAAGTISI